MHRRARNHEVSDETGRYQTAAAAALDQLDWVINYLYRIRKPDLAAALKRNRDDVARRLR
jgi:hypothetical protein